MKAPTLLILAAGMGSRYGGLRVDEPLGPFGQTILNYSIYDASQAGFERFIFVVRPEVEKSFRHFVNERLGNDVHAEFVCQSLADLPHNLCAPLSRIKPWGTTHAVLSVRAVIREPFGVVNVNDFYGPSSFETLIHHLRSSPTEQAVVGFVLRTTLPEIGPAARAVCRVDSTGLLKQIEELKYVEQDHGHILSTAFNGSRTPLRGDETISMNMWAFNTDVFSLFEQKFDEFIEHHRTNTDAECSIPDTVSSLLAEKALRVRVLHSDDHPFTLTYPEDHTRAAANLHQLTLEGYYPLRLQKHHLETMGHR